MHPRTLPLVILPVAVSGVVHPVRPEVLEAVSRGLPVQLPLIRIACAATRTPHTRAD